MCMVSFTKQNSYSSLEKIKKFSGRPNWAYVVVTDRCSHKCSWCYGGFDADLKNEMSVAVFTQLTDKLQEMGVVQLTLAGGEPTEHPDFRDLLRIAHNKGFVIHICTHGEHIDQELAEFMVAHGVRQVQVNFQGRKRHDAVHGISGSHERQIAAIGHLHAAGIDEVTTTATVGAYNVKDLPEIFAEAADLGVKRLRVWETTGRGKPWLRDREAKAIFTAAEESARALGYQDILSYDPEYQAPRMVACPQFANLYMYITVEAKLRFCGAVPGGKELEIIDLLNHSADEIIAAYIDFNRKIQGNRKPWCVARLGFDPPEQPLDMGEGHVETDLVGALPVSPQSG